MSLEDFSEEERELAQLSRQLASDPATRKEFLRLTKKVRPDVPMPEIDIEETTSRAIQQQEDRYAQLEAKMREREAVEELTRRRQDLLKKRLIDSEDQIQEVEKVMLEKGITNHEAAAEYWSWMKESAQPTPTVGYNPNPINKFDLSKFWKNPTAGARDEAAKALMELRKNPKPIGL
jgi:TolA-binding protein